MQLYAEKQLLLTEQIGQNIIHIMQDNLKELKALSMVSRLDQFSGMPCQEEYRILRKQLVGEDHLYTIRFNGDISRLLPDQVYHTDGVDTLITRTDWQKRLPSLPDSGLLILSDTLYHRHATLLYQFTNPDKTGKRILFVSILDLQRRVSEIMAGKLRRNSHTFILTEDGILLYHSLHPEMVFNDINNATPSCFTCHNTFDQEKQLIDQVSGWSQKTEFNGEKRLVSNATLDIFGQKWTLAVDRPMEIVLQASREQFWIFFLLTFSLLTVVVGGGWILFYTRNKRIEAEHQRDVYRTRAEYTDLLQEAEEKYRTLVEQSPDAIVIYQNAKIVFTNAPFLKLFEIDRDVPPEKIDYLSHIDKESLKILRQRIPEIAQKETNILTLPITGITNSGKARQLEIYISTITYKKNPAYHIVLHDLTEINRREAEARRKKYFALIGEMSARVAHEIKNPLASIQTGIRLIETSQPQDQEHRDYFQNLVNEVQRVDHIVKGLLSLAREEKLALHSLDIVELMHKVIDLIKLTLDNQHVKLNFVSDSEQITIDADPEKLEQVFWNTILNACEAVGSEGEINVEIERKDSTVVISIHDSGTGISDQVADKIFQPFYSTKCQGSGLGLAISQKIIDLHGGSISVSNNKPKGVTVQITLPGAQK